ncbi:MAG: mechanosensitive ion channel family protein [Phycisphaerae bacterium]|nr:mechanosensitive ion channel family protein [Phycisphaerae bacterium]
MAREFLFWRLTRWSKKTQTQFDDIVIAAIRVPFVIWFVMLGLYLALETLALPDSLASETNVARLDGVVVFVERLLMVLGYLSITFALANVAGKAIEAYAGRFETALPVTSLTQYVARIVILTLGVLVILHKLGIPIAPMLATLGVGGLAVALALQDTLSNLFAGFHIIVARQIRVGDFIRLESGEEGVVTDIHWRTTQVRMPPNNIVLIPNDRLAKAIVVNYYLPDKEMGVVVPMGVHYASDLKKVEQVTMDVARQVMKEVPGGVPTFEPFIRYHTFAEYSINFNVILRAREFGDQHVIRHEFIKRIHERYAREGIVIPCPIRAINTAQEGAGPPAPTK